MENTDIQKALKPRQLLLLNNSSTHKASPSDQSHLPQGYDLKQQSEAYLPWNEAQEGTLITVHTPSGKTNPSFTAGMNKLLLQECSLILDDSILHLLV